MWYKLQPSDSTFKIDQIHILKNAILHSIKFWVGHWSSTFGLNDSFIDLAISDKLWPTDSTFKIYQIDILKYAILHKIQFWGGSLNFNFWLKWLLLGYFDISLDALNKTAHFSAYGKKCIFFIFLNQNLYQITAFGKF